MGVYSKTLSNGTEVKYFTSSKTFHIPECSIDERDLDEFIDFINEVKALQDAIDKIQT